MAPNFTYHMRRVAHSAVFRKPWKLLLLLSAGLTAAFLPLGILQHGLDTPTPVGPYLNNAFPAVTPGQGSGAWQLEDVFPNLSFASPIHLEEEPGGNRLLVAEWGGEILAVDNTPSAATTQSFLNLSGQVHLAGESGLLSFTLHPRYGLDSNYVYVFYQYRTASMSRTYSRLSRFTVPAGQTAADPSSELVLIQLYDRASNHNAGSIFFGNDGYLYISTGDEGGADNPFNNCQRLDDRLLGGILRIDVNRNPATSHPILRQPALIDGSDQSYTANYFIPNDNPFVDSTGGQLEEFYALGLRNPHRISFDSISGQIWCGDVGQGAREEVNLIEAGGNYGWGFKEGSITGPQPPPTPVLGTVEDPVHEYSHSLGNCVIGGYVYRGSTHPDLYGRYLFADNGSKRLWAMSYQAGQAPVVEELMTMPFGSSYYSISAFARDRSGEVYILRFNGAATNGGKIYRLTRQNPGAPEPPLLLSQTGAFQNLATLTPEDYLIPYEMNVPFWSDGALKRRWLALPNDGVMDSPAEQILFSEQGKWQMPEGAVAVKHFDLALDETNPAQTRRIETRFLVRGTSGYYGVTYRWRADQSDADLLVGSRTDTLSLQTASGPTQMLWYYPSRSDCMTCHNESAGGILGLSTRQLNRDCFYPLSGRTANQLTTLSHIGAFDTPPDTNALAALLSSAPSQNTALPLEDRALSYLDANCGYCHRPGVGIQARFDARLRTPLKERGLIYAMPYSNTLGVHDARLILPEEADASILQKRLASVHRNFSMPPLAKNHPDTAGVRLIAEWINSLDPSLEKVCATFNFDDYLISAYETNQDFGTAEVQANGSVLLLEDNAWKKIPLVYTVTPNTVLEFDFQSSIEGEEHAIGFDSDDASDGNRFQLFGTQATGSFQAFNTYAGGSGWQHFTIPVGTYFTGSFNRMIFLADHDAAPANGNSYFRNVKLYEGSCSSKLNQRISFPHPGKQVTTTPSFGLTATSSSGRPVSFQLISGPGSLTGNIITLTGQPGILRVRAVQPGDASYEAAPEVEHYIYVAPPDKATGNGLSATYYNQVNLSQMAAGQIDTTIDFVWGNRAPMSAVQHGSFSVVWEGEIESPVSGTVNFTTLTDDGVRLWVNNQLIINHWQDQIATEHSGSIALTAWQRVPIRMEYYQNQAYGVAQLFWTGSGIPQQVVPKDFLYFSPVLSSAPLAFEAQALDDRVALRWSLDQSTQTGHFEIERSADAQSFALLQRLAPQKGQVGLTEYTSEDRQPLPGLSYYRLRTVRKDGSFDYSQIEAVWFDPAKAGLALKVYPSPLAAGETLLIEVGGADGPFDVVLLDAQGREILAQRQVGQVERMVRLQPPQLAPGIYYVRVSTPLRQQVEKIVIR